MNKSLHTVTNQFNQLIATAAHVAALQVRELRDIAAAVCGAFQPIVTLPQGPVSMPYVNMAISHLCNDDPATIEWLLRWIAYPLRHPRAKMATAVWVRGGQGSGKNLIFEQLMGAMYGDAALMVNHEFNSPFNGWADGKRLALVDEFDHQRDGAQLKNLLTSTKLIITRKGLPHKIVRNRLNFVFLSGHIDALPATHGNRRFFVIEQPSPLPREFYDAAADEILRGGVDMFREYLTEQLDMGDFNERTPAPRQLREGN